MTRNYSVTHSKKWNLLAVAVLAMGVSACDVDLDANAAQAERSALIVDVEALHEEAFYTIERSFAGRVEARRRSDIGFELGGELELVRVEEGDYVERGQVLAQLDTARLKARLAEAEAAVQQSRSASNFAGRTLERSEVAASFEGISEQELDLAVDAANAAEASLAAAEARVNSMQVDLSKASLKAPFDAVVITRWIDEGQILSPGQPVLSLQESAAPQVRIGVSGGLADALSPGDSLKLRINRREVPAHVNAILPVRDPATRTVDVILTVDDVQAVPGDLARLELEQQVSEAGFWLPIGALAEGNRGLWTAYVAMPVEKGAINTGGATHFLQPRPVEVLYESTERVYVRGALREGDQFVTGGLARVVPNQQVRLRASTDAASGS